MLKNGIDVADDRISKLNHVRYFHLDLKKKKTIYFLNSFVGIYH